MYITSYPHYLTMHILLKTCANPENTLHGALIYIPFPLTRSVVAGTVVTGSVASSKKLIIHREFIEINKHKKKLQIYIRELMAAHIIVDN